MALDKLVDSAQLDSDLASVADAIRTKGGTSADLAFPDGFVDAIEAISGGGDGYLDALIARSITSIESNVASIGNYAFYNCSNLTTVSFPNVTNIGEYAFAKTGLTEITETLFPSLRLASTYSFREMPSLTRLFFPNVKIGLSAFYKCTALRTAIIKSFMYNNNFASCGSLMSVDVSLDAVPATAFKDCTSLATLILRSTSLQPLQNTSAFNSTPFASGGSGGTLYVPSAMIASYQAATNWSTILGYSTNSILPIEGSIYETQYADGTPIPTE